LYFQTILEKQIKKPNKNIKIVKISSKSFSILKYYARTKKEQEKGEEVGK